MLKFPGTGTTLPFIIARGVRHGKDMTLKTTSASPDALASAPNIVEFRKEAWGDLRYSFKKFCLTCGIKVLQGMKEGDVAELAGERHERAPDKPGYRWGSRLPDSTSMETRLPRPTQRPRQERRQGNPADDLCKSTC